MFLRRPTPVLAVVGLLAGLLAAPAVANAAPDQELPFPCAEQWTGSTRPQHRPSPLAVDFNRVADYGRLVVASGAGVVLRVGDSGSSSYGRWIQIQHPEGYSTLYAHLKAQWVAPGQFVDQGAPIGRVGDTGGVTGAHLHYEQRSGSTLVPAVFHQTAFVYGSTEASQNCPDVPLSGNWSGGRAAEVAVFRRDVVRGTFELATPDGLASESVRFGRSSDLPVTGDWDGDGLTDLGVRRQAVRKFLLRASDGTVTRTRFGRVKDVPVTGDWNGDGRTDVGLWRPVRALFVLRNDDGSSTAVRLGTVGSQPVTGDWDGDGSTDLGVFDAAGATFSLRTVASDGNVMITPVALGTSTDLPVTGDWNGDQVTDLGTWSPATATFTLRVAPAVTASRRSASPAPEIRTLAFGRPR